MKKPIKNIKKTTKKEEQKDKIKREIRKICKKNPKIKQKIKNITELEKKLYYALVWETTEEQPLYILENFDKRGWKNYHLDHIYSISAGFYNNIPPELIGNIKNLRFIHYKENLDKGSKITNESIKALRRIKRIKKPPNTFNS